MWGWGEVDEKKKKKGEKSHLGNGYYQIMDEVTIEGFVYKINKLPKAHHHVVFVTHKKGNLEFLMSTRFGVR